MFYIKKALHQLGLLKTLALLHWVGTLIWLRSMSTEPRIMPRKFPNLFIIGAMRAGTSSLHQYLDQHPEIFMAKSKEPQYFAPHKARYGWWEQRLKSFKNFEGLNFFLIKFWIELSQQLECCVIIKLPRSSRLSE